jgi:hypothetical protein
MTTKLEKELKREIQINEEPYTVTLSPVGLKLTQKGKRKGQELAWKDIINGQGATTSDMSTSGDDGE